MASDLQRKKRGHRSKPPEVYWAIRRHFGPRTLQINRQGGKELVQYLKNPCKLGEEGRGNFLRTIYRTNQEPEVAMRRARIIGCDLRERGLRVLEEEGYGRCAWCRRWWFKFQIENLHGYDLPCPNCKKKGVKVRDAKLPDL